jgi:hypothetical protein
MSRAAVAAATAGMLAAIPATADAAGVSVTGDDGQPQALVGQTIRNMAPQIIPVLTNSERALTITVTGPGGQAAISTSPCNSAPSARPLTFLGNGTYTATLAGFNDAACAVPSGPSATFTFAIGAGVALGVDPNGPLLTRLPGELATVEHRIPFTGNPGADTYDVFYSSDPRLAPDGSLAGAKKQGYVDAATATVPLRFPRPGSYSVVARARVYSGGASPWTAPVVLKLFAPFDFTSSSFPDSSGPTYRLRVQVRERSARGRVYISAARGWTGSANYRSLGHTSISTRGVFAKRFRLTRTGTYRIRYRFTGGTTTAPGVVTEKVRIRRTVRASSAASAASVGGGPATIGVVR